MSDARISISLPGHPKTKRLIKRLGPEAAWFLVRLFLWAAENKPDGNLAGQSAEDIELAIDWTGEDGALVAALSEVRFLDGVDGSYAIHDWAEHNPWVSGSDMRSAKARWNAIKRHHGIREADLQVPEWAARRHAESDATSSAASNAGSTAASSVSTATSNAPSPSPSPSPKPQELRDVGEIVETPKSEAVGGTRAAPEKLTPALACRELHDLGVSGLNPSYAPLHEAIEEGVDREGLLASARAAVKKGKGRLDYIVARARGRLRDGDPAIPPAAKQAQVEQRNASVAAAWADQEGDHAAV
ncbi:hypothetical protein [Dyella sp.]|uniref:hypothetical protein n=1 Tax=Dyella sp. TaxID=1869338 RepID=UPI003F7CE393